MMMPHSKINLNKFKLALDAVSELYGVKKQSVVNTKCRKKPVPDARRMLVYYMYNHLKITHNHMQDYIDNLCHATSIYHCKKLEGYLDNERDTRLKYLLFRDKTGEFKNKLLELEVKKDELKKLQREVRKISKTIKNVKRI